MNFSEYRFLTDVLQSFQAPDDATGGSMLDKIVKLGKTFEDFFSNEGRKALKRIEVLHDEYVDFKPVATHSNVAPGSSDAGGPEVIDLRFKSVGVDNFRAFPKNDRKFGLKFESKDSVGPCSFIGIGNNGVGKSSFFDAMEWKCTGRVSEMEFRNSDSDDASCKLPDFIRHHGENASETTEANVCILTEGGEGLFKGFTLSPFFCTEKDLVDMVREMPKDIRQDWIPYLFSFSGYKAIYNLISDLRVLKEEFGNELFITDELEVDRKVDDALVEFMKLERDIAAADEFRSLGWKLHDRICVVMDAEPKSHSFDIGFGFINSLFRTYKEKVLNPGYINRTIPGETGVITIKKIQDLIISIKNRGNGIDADHESEREVVNPIKQFDELNDGIQKIIADSLAKRKSDFEIRLNKIKKKHVVTPSDRSEEKWNKLADYVALLSEKCSTRRTEVVKEIAGGLFDWIKTFLADNEFIVPDSEELKFEGESDIKLNIIRNNADGIRVPVAVYLNTFRTKLVALLIRVGLAMSIREHEHVNFPLVFDDIFYSSDFDNKYKLSAFFKSLFDIFGKSESKMPLQIIFFTHDELMISICQESLRRSEGYEVVFARMFSHYLVEEKWTDAEFDIVMNNNTIPCKNLAVNLFEA